MARQTNAAITFNDALYMVANEGFTAKQTIPSSQLCMTKSDIDTYLNCVQSNYSTYTNIRLVPYHLLSPIPVGNNPPSVPSKISAVQEGTYIKVSWGASTDSDGTVTGYEIWRKVGTGSYTLLTTLGTVTTYNDSNNLVDDTEYSYMIKSIDNDGARSVGGTTAGPVLYDNGGSIVTYIHDLSFSNASGQACTDYNSGYSTTYYGNNTQFRASTKLYTNSAGTSFAPGGYYSNGIDVATVTTNGTITNFGPCGF